MSAKKTYEKLIRAYGLTGAQLEEGHPVQAEFGDAARAILEFEHDKELPLLRRVTARIGSLNSRRDWLSRKKDEFREDRHFLGELIVEAFVEGKDALQHAGKIAEIEIAVRQIPAADEILKRLLAEAERERDAILSRQGKTVLECLHLDPFPRKREREEWNHLVRVIEHGVTA